MTRSPCPTLRLFLRPAVRRLLLASLAFLLPLLLFLPAVRFGFVDLDDGFYIESNRLATAPLTLSGIRAAFLSRGPANLHVPLVWLSYMLDVALYGNHPWAFHLSNVLLHAFSSLLLFLLLPRLSALFAPRPSPLADGGCPRPAVSLLLALLWALHPLRVESVAWATERKDCLAALFCLLVLHAWLSSLLSSRRSRRLLLAAAALVFFSCGLLSKPSLVPLPFFLALLALAVRWAPRSTPGGPPVAARPSLVPCLCSLLPFFLLSALSSFATAAIHGELNAFAAPPFLARLATVPSVLLFYLAKTVLPLHLAVIYPRWTSPFWLGVLLAIPFLAAAVWLLKRRRAFPLPFFGAAFAALAFLPVCGLVPIPFNLVADRYSLLPSMGLSIALLHPFLPRERRNVRNAVDLPARRKTGKPAILWGALCLAVAAETAATSLQLPVWTDTASLFLPVRRLLPDHYAVRAFDAQTATRLGLFHVSRQCIARARAAAPLPDYRLLLADVPNVCALDGPQAALSLLLDNPPPPPEHLARWSLFHAALLLDLDRPADARAALALAIPRVPPADALRRPLLQAAALAAFRLGDAPAALSQARRAGLLPPSAETLAEPHFLPFFVWLWDNDLKGPAIRFFRSIAAAHPSPSVLNNLAWLLASSPWSPSSPSEALSYARGALASIPPSSPLRPFLLDTLSVALANVSDFPAAVSSLSEAIALLPPSSPSLPAMRARLDLYRQSLPYRELLGAPLPPSLRSFDPRL